MRLVVDTNGVVSAFLWGGPPARILRAAVEGRCQLFTSGTLIAELEDVLSREKFRARLVSVGVGVAELIAGYLDQVTVVHAEPIAPTIAADPDDDHVLACALAAKADLIVSGDHHLLSLTTYRNTPRKSGSGESPACTSRWRFCDDVGSVPFSKMVLDVDVPKEPRGQS
jgi:putative PIN family toxin of toxin-antitoxin system